MKRSDWVIPGLVLLSCGTVLSLGAEPSGASTLNERIKTQEARIPQIEALAAQERDQTESSYEQQRAQIVQRITRRAAAQLSFRERKIWVQFVDVYHRRPYAPDFFDFGLTAGIDMVMLGEAMTQEYLISQMADLLVDPQFEQKLEEIVEERVEAPLLPLLREQAWDLLAFMKKVRAECALETARLENGKKARLEANMEWERNLKEQVHGILEYLRQRESRPTRFGVVESVGYCVNSGYYCMIEGVDRVLEVGDTVGDVRVLKIDVDNVEFAHGGATWTQGLGAPPQPFWERTE